MCRDQWPGRCLGITSRDPSVCKSNRLHVDILQFSFIKLGCILWNPLKRSVIFLQSWTSTGYFSNSTGSSVTHCRFFPIMGRDANLTKCILHFALGDKYQNTTGFWRCLAVMATFGCWEQGALLTSLTLIPGPANTGLPKRDTLFISFLGWQKMSPLDNPYVQFATGNPFGV